MPNTVVAFGFRPVKEPDPSSLLTVTALASYATALFVGDAVIPGGTADPIYGYPTVTRSLAGSTNVMGIIVGFERLDPDSTSLATKNPGAASTLRYIKIAPTFQSTVFECMANASTDVTAVGNGFDIDATAGSAVTGFSGMGLDVSTIATTLTTLRLLSLINRPDNDFASAQTGIKCHVFFAESLWNNGPGV